jgi:hypothetical protein
MMSLETERYKGRDTGILLWECYYLLAARHCLLLLLWGKDLKLRCDKLTQLHGYWVVSELKK